MILLSSPRVPFASLAKEFFFYRETNELLELLDEAARRSGKSRPQAFEDFLELVICTLSGGEMEDDYLAVAHRYADGEQGKRGIDVLANTFGALVKIMDKTREECLPRGDLFHRTGTRYLEPCSAVESRTVVRAAPKSRIWRDSMQDIRNDQHPPRAQNHFPSGSPWRISGGFCQPVTSNRFCRH